MEVSESPPMRIVIVQLLYFGEQGLDGGGRTFIFHEHIVEYEPERIPHGAILVPLHMVRLYWRPLPADDSLDHWLAVLENKTSMNDQQ